MKRGDQNDDEAICRPDPGDEADSGDPARTTRIALQGS